MRLGDWLPPCPLQGVALEPIAPGLYQMRAVGVVGAPQDATDGGVMDIGGASLHVDPMPDGVGANIRSAPSWDLTINCTESQARAFASHYGGVAHLVSGGKIIIKAIAPGMRKETK